MPNRTFVHTKVFDRLWESLGCNDDDLSELQKAIMESPDGYPVIRGTGGVRKIRIALEGRGKSGGARVIYGDFPDHGIVYLFAAYPKSAKEDITSEEKKFFKMAMNQADKDWRNRK